MVERIPRQRTFDLVARHLRAQGRPSVTGDPPRAAYRGDDGCSCSAGCLIPDELYEAGMEGRSVSDDQPAGVVISELGHDTDLVLQLQLLHDGLLETWSAVGISVALRMIAASFDLDPREATGSP